MKNNHISYAGGAAALAFMLPQIAAADPTFEFYGQINFGIFSVDDGEETETFLADNDNSNTRFGLRYVNELSNGATLRFNFETAVGFEGSSSATITNNDSDWDPSRTDLRKLEIAYETPSYGTFYVGQGSMSTDGIAESDFSGTGVIAYSGFTDLAGSFSFRQADGSLSDVTIGSSFGAFDGARRLRVRYDTPSFNGFTGSISYGEEELNRDDDREFTDVALRYKEDVGDLKLNGGIGYQWIEDDGADEEVLVGSFALLHVPSGVSFLLASGDRDEGGESYYFAKLGYQQEWFSAGTTALSIDFFDGSDYGSDGSDSESWGIAAVQFVDAYSLELFATYRAHEFNASGSNFDDIDVFALGARWKF